MCKNAARVLEQTDPPLKNYGESEKSFGPAGSLMEMNQGFSKSWLNDKSSS